MTRSRSVMVATAAACLAVLASVAHGAGMLIPADQNLPPLAVKYLRVDATIDNQAAVTRVVQEFQNSTDSNLECTYVFPLPRQAAIRDFAMYIGGKRMKGELLEKDRARQVYEEIVRRARDPGLLEYIDCNLLRLRIFPVPARGTQKVEIEYSEVVPMDDGLAEYVFPLRVGEKASRTLEDFTVAVRIRSDVAIKSVYSPTHEVGVSRPSDREAVAGMESRSALLDRDFQLFYTVSEKDFGLHLLTYRPDADQPGTFLMLMSPRSELRDDRRVPRDLALVLDTSGSMKEGDKMGQARKALKFCLDKLDRQDRFAIVQFSTAAQAFADGWTQATEEPVRKAHQWIDQFEASGGTNLSEALQKVLALPIDDDRPTTILLVTDGRPTVDLTDTEALLKLVKDHNRRSVRIFTFGVGDDVNTKLLDRLSGESGALTEYVRPGEAIDAKTARLFSKMTHPVLTDLVLEVPGVQITEMYPRRLPDLFRGSQVVIVGAYKGAGESVIRLKGRSGQKHEEFVYEGTFPARSTDRPFIGPLFAQRKIGYLLDQIRLHGENRELKDEVIRLSLAYGIETPYTSYLVLESPDQFKQYGITTLSVPAGPPHGRAPTARPAAGAGGPSSAAKAADTMERRAGRIEAAYGLNLAAAAPPAVPSVAAEPSQAIVSTGVRADLADLRDAETGSTAVDIAQQIHALRQAERQRSAGNVQHRAGRLMVRYRGVWVDDRFQGTEKLARVKWGSQAYFALLRLNPALREVFSLGERVVLVTARGQAVAIDPDQGAEELADGDLKGLFVDLPG